MFSETNHILSIWTYEHFCHVVNLSSKNNSIRTTYLHSYTLPVLFNLNPFTSTVSKLSILFKGCGRLELRVLPSDAAKIDTIMIN